MSWQRPKNVQFPKVWLEFEGKIKVNGKPLKYRVQDVSEDLIEPCVEHMVRYFCPREAFIAHDGILEDEVSLKEIRAAWTLYLRQRVTPVAIVEGEGPESSRIAGINMLFVSHKNDPKPVYKGRAMIRLCLVLDELYERENLFEKYGVDCYLNALGLSVAPQYQGDGVGLHLMKARTPMCAALGIPLAVTPYSNPAAVHEAEKEGYDVIQLTTADKLFIDGEPVYPRLKDRIYALAAKRY